MKQVERAWCLQDAFLRKGDDLHVDTRRAGLLQIEQDLDTGQTELGIEFGLRAQAGDAVFDAHAERRFRAALDSVLALVAQRAKIAGLYDVRPSETKAPAFA